VKRLLLAGGEPLVLTMVGCGCYSPLLCTSVDFRESESREREALVLRLR
jgi:hypothetical protein